MPSRSLKELEELIANEPGAPLLDKVEEENRPDLTVAATRIVSVNPKPSIEMVAATRNPPNTVAETASTVRFIKGMSVRHSDYGVGTVLENGVPCFLETLGLWDEHVTVQFAGASRTFAANLAGLTVD